MFELYFCADGVLRVKGKKGDPLVPLQSIQNAYPALKDRDFKFWLDWWDTPVFFEEGLTVAKFLFCLQPWQEFWSEYTGKDVAAYIKEAKKPVLVKSTTESEESAPLDWIKIYSYVEIEPEVEYHRDSELGEKEDLLKWLNSPKSMRLSGLWNISNQYRISGYVKGEKEQYSVEDSPIFEIANTPLVLDSTQFVFFATWQLNRQFGSGHKQFSPEAFGVLEVASDSACPFYVLKGEKRHKIKDVIDAFFWWRASTPEKREEFLQSLKDAVSGLDEDIQNVSTSETETSSELTEDNPPRKIAIAPGAFDSVIAHHEKEADIWQQWVSNAKSDPNCILKIGELKTATPLEDRIFSEILNPQDPATQIKPSEYKKD